MLIDATNKIVGRIATVAAKQALLGNKVDIINCEKAIITGRRALIFEKLKNNDDRGEPFHGPFQEKMPDRMLRGMIRGMLPYKLPKGKAAWKRIMCHIGVPPEFASEKPTDIKGADVSKVPNMRYVRVGELSKLLGAKL